MPVAFLYSVGPTVKFMAHGLMKGELLSMYFICISCKVTFGIDQMRWCYLGVANHAGHGVLSSLLWLLSQSNYVE